MIKAACHCGAVRFEIGRAPDWVLDCNCTLCRRYGALWSYYFGAAQALLMRVPEPTATETYVWGDKSLAFHRCKACGCISHMEAIDIEPHAILGINSRLMVGLDPAKVQLRQIDNGHLGVFWTRSNEAPMPGRHPKMPPSGPDDWR